MDTKAIMAAIAGLGATFMGRGGIWDDRKGHACVAYRWPSRKTTTAAQLKRAAKKRANARARSKK